MQLHLTALGSLRGEIGELHARLQRAAQDRDTLEQALAKTQVLSPVYFYFAKLIISCCFDCCCMSAGAIAIGAGK